MHRLDGHGAAEARIDGFVHLAHAARANRHDDFIGAEPLTWRQGRHGSQILSRRKREWRKEEVGGSVLARVRASPTNCYFTLSTVMVSPLALPLTVTCLPAIGTTLSWLAILYTLPLSVSRTAGEPALMHLFAQSTSPFMLATFEHFSSMIYPLYSAAITLPAKPAVNASAKIALCMLSSSE